MSSTSEAAPDETGKVMSFRDHLMELRRRLMRVALVLVIGFFVGWEMRHVLFEFVSRPVEEALADNGIYGFQAISLTESIVVYLKTAFVADLFFLSPYIFWEMWAFISPGLYRREKRFVLPLTAFSVAFFLLGAAFAYVVLLPFLTDWLVNITLEGGHNVLVTVQNAYGFAVLFLLMFGLVFELPLVLFFLALWGSVTGKALLRFWRYFVVISFLMSAMLTPPDPISQVMMALPLNVLYGFGVVTAFTVSRARASGRADASRLALRAMSLAMLGLLILGGGLFLYLGGIPDKPLTAWAPDSATFAAGLNPRILAQEKSVLSLVRGADEAAEVLDALSARADIDDITDGMLIGLPEGRRALLLRASGLGKEPPKGATAIDEDTVAFGSPEVVRAIAAREPREPQIGAEGDRLLRRLAGAGPLWVWLPPTSGLREALLGADNARELASVGVALSLGERRQLIFDIPLALNAEGGADSAAERTERTARADRVLARIEAARVSALADTSGAPNRKLVAALVELADILVELAPPPMQARIRAIKGQVSGEAEVHPAFPALSALAPHLQGVSVRRDDNRLTLTATLDDQGLATVFRVLAGR